MSAATDAQFDALVAGFVIAPYQPVSEGGHKVTSFRSGTPGAAAFYWQAPAGRAYIVNTQAPWLVERIQQAVGVAQDGRFGDQTRRAIIANARANGVNFADEEPVLAPLLAYAINRALFGGQGRVGLPGAVVFPNINDARRATGSSTYLRIRDLATGRDVALAPVTLPTGQTVSLPTNANVPPPVAPPGAVPPPAPLPGPGSSPALPEHRTEARPLSGDDRAVLTAAANTPAAPGLARAFISAEAPPNAGVSWTPWEAGGTWRLVERRNSPTAMRVIAEGPPQDALPVRLTLQGAATPSEFMVRAVAGQQTNVVLTVDATGRITGQQTWMTPIAADAAAARPESAPVGNNALAPVLPQGVQPYPVAAPLAPTVPEEGWSTTKKVVVVSVVGAVVGGGIAYYGRTQRWW